MEDIVTKSNVQDNNDNNDNNDDNIKIKRTRNRLTKKQQFVKEREEFIKELNSVIGLSEKRNSIFKNEIEKNENVTKFIIDSDERIKQIFKAGNWGYYTNEEIRGKGNILGLIRSIYNDCDYEINSKLKTSEFDNIKKQYTLMTFVKKA